jgi:ppGpp synthetase/RelA/SpoT-type nucleotidyltranferase
LYALKAALEQAAIKYHSLPSRVKSPESFLEKVKRRETRESEEVQRGEWDPLKEIQDIVGLRVVCLYLSDVERIATVVRNTFQVLSEDNKIEGTEVSSFGYMSVHFVAVMKAEYITSLLASQSILGWNQIISWLKEMESLRNGCLKSQVWPMVVGK